MERAMSFSLSWDQIVVAAVFVGLVVIAIWAKKPPRNDSSAPVEPVDMVDPALPLTMSDLGGPPATHSGVGGDSGSAGDSGGGGGK
jgi:hypothetical protein